MIDENEILLTHTYINVCPNSEAKITEEPFPKPTELSAILELDEYETDPEWWALHLFFLKS